MENGEEKEIINNIKEKEEKKEENKKEKLEGENDKDKKEIIKNEEILNYSFISSYQLHNH